MSCPSIRILPPQTSIRRKRTWKSVLFPDPVRPMMPTLAPSGARKVTPFSTSGSDASYRART